MGQIQSLDEFLGLLLRRRLVIAAVAVLGTVLAVLFSLSRPAIFEAAAVIQVESPTVAGDPNVPVTTGSAQRLQSIQQRLTTRENLLAMIERHGLYAGLPLSNDEKVHMLRLSIRFQTVQSAAPVSYGSPPQVSALIIFAQADDGERAARLANDFAQGILDAGAEGQSGRARESVAFFSGEAQRVAGQLAALEAQIASYKNGHADALPAVRDLRRDEIVGIESDLRAIEAELAAIASEQLRIQANGRALRETDRRQLETLAARTQALDARRKSLTDRRAVLTTSMAAMPEVERVLAGYDRDLAALQASYDQINGRLAEAETAAKLEERQQSERFMLLERAVRPDFPITGGRRKLAAMGALASLMAGVVVAFVLDLMNPVLRTTAQMERQLGLRPMVAIPVISGLRPAGSGAGLRLARGQTGGRALNDQAQALVGRFLALPRPRLVMAGSAALLLMLLAVLV